VLTNVRFGPDFISWNFYADPVADLSTIKKDTMRLDREALTIEGDYLVKNFSSGVGGYFQMITVVGQCKKTDIPWEKLKPKQV